jgi:hypothetical protein
MKMLLGIVALVLLPELPESLPLLAIIVGVLIEE